MRTKMIPDRWEKIIDMVETLGGATVDQIAEAVGISPTTARRDLASIQRRGLIKRTRGGAAPEPRVRVGPTLAESRRINPENKEIIGRAAASLIHNGDTIMIDGGFTTYQAARNLQATEITVITNSLDVAQVLAGREDTTVMMIGGELSAVTGTNLGSVAVTQIDQYWADVAILGADAVSPSKGITSPNEMTSVTKRAMISASKKLIVVADHTKLGRCAPYRVSSADNISTLITDNKADKAILDEFRAMGVETILVPHADDEKSH